jgi:hypothetical protein
LFAIDDLLECSQLSHAQALEKKVIGILESKRLELTENNHVNNLLKAFQDIYNRLRACASED